MAFTGAAKIVRFNWPWYAGVVALDAAAAIALATGTITGQAAGRIVAGLVAANFWMIASLVVSHYVYDRSGVATGAWLASIEPASVRRAAVFHGGLNEAAPAVARFLPLTDVRNFDFYDRSAAGSASLERARARVDRESEPIGTGPIPLEDGSLDLGLVVFSAHEIRRDEDRAAFFADLARTLAPGGRVLVVEHLRDAWNLIAYGPGAFHFLPASAWKRSFSGGRLAIVRQAACTPLVRVFELGRAP
jgi:SAM-dependent methyltransferase